MPTLLSSSYRRGLNYGMLSEAGLQLSFFGDPQVHGAAEKRSSPFHLSNSTSNFSMIMLIE